MTSSSPPSRDRSTAIDTSIDISCTHDSRKSCRRHGPGPGEAHTDPDPGPAASRPGHSYGPRGPHRFHAAQRLQPPGSTERQRARKGRSNGTPGEVPTSQPVRRSAGRGHRPGLGCSGPSSSIQLTPGRSSYLLRPLGRTPGRCDSRGIGEGRSDRCAAPGRRHRSRPSSRGLRPAPCGRCPSRRGAKAVRVRMPRLDGASSTPGRSVGGRCYEPPPRRRLAPASTGDTSVAPHVQGPAGPTPHSGTQVAGSRVEDARQAPCLLKSRLMPSDVPI
jgi:hypothetical protein